ncbi:MAG: hypothetical protein M5R40_14825 [Anaerolineae bacterium]|nr:hypothetical protein [Anaerolineae bacterium]
MEGEQIGRVVRLGRGWVEVDVGGALRRVIVPPGLSVRVGNYVVLRSDVAVSVSAIRTHLIPPETPLPSPTDVLPR